jgi:hypothetical protein
MNLAVIGYGGGDWNLLAQDKDKRMVLAKAIMNIWSYRISYLLKGSVIIAIYGSN